MRRALLRRSLRCAADPPIAVSLELVADNDFRDEFHGAYRCGRDIIESVSTTSKNRPAGRRKTGASETLAAEDGGPFLKGFLKHVAYRCGRDIIESVSTTSKNRPAGRSKTRRQ
jgi:hypothetical protein